MKQKTYILKFKSLTMCNLAKRVLSRNRIEFEEIKR
jgi:hypothetical protein